MSEPVLEVPPSGEPLPEFDSEEYPLPITKTKKKKRRKRKIETVIDEMDGQEPRASPQVVTQEHVQALVVGTMSGLAFLLDESYAVVDKEGQILPHVHTACAQMLPWAQQYGETFVRTLPWLGLIGGLTMLIAPALEPTIEIIAGVRNPRILRKTPGDVYTDKYKMRLMNRPAVIKPIKEESDAN
jgi:hypothetical protein